MLLDKKVAIVTGGAQGIGGAISELFCKEGANVIIADINIGKSMELSNFLTEKFGKECIGIKVDVSKRDDVENMVRLTVERFGKIDILVNNAGILIENFILDITEDEWDKIHDINLKGAFLCSQAVAKEMIKQKNGKIISISTCSAKKPTLKQAAYSASKAGILGFNRVLALELGRYGINCNAILPGATDTEMVRSTFITSSEIEMEWIEKTALKRLGKPVDQANVALFLASYLSDHITGESIIVSAGEMMGQ